MKVAGKYQLRACRIRNQDTFPLVEGAPGRIRTCDTGFRRAVLYPLSYGGPRAVWQL